MIFVCLGGSGHGSDSIGVICSVTQAYSGHKHPRVMIELLYVEVGDSEVWTVILSLMPINIILHFLLGRILTRAIFARGMLTDVGIMISINGHEIASNADRGCMMDGVKVAGRVKRLYLHPKRALKGPSRESTPMISVDSMDFTAPMFGESSGIVGEQRRATGKRICGDPGSGYFQGFREVSMIEREVLVEITRRIKNSAMGDDTKRGGVDPGTEINDDLLLDGCSRSNIETSGIDLAALVRPLNHPVMDKLGLDKPSTDESMGTDLGTEVKDVSVRHGPKGKYLYGHGTCLHLGPDVVLVIWALREPCWKMNKIYPGLEQMMMPGMQGVYGFVLKGGQVRVGDVISVGQQFSAKFAKPIDPSVTPPIIPTIPKSHFVQTT
jgi:hypothetical protein